MISKTGMAISILCTLIVAASAMVISNFSDYQTLIPVAFVAKQTYSPTSQSPSPQPTSVNR